MTAPPESESVDPLASVSGQLAAADAMPLEDQPAAYERIHAAIAQALDRTVERTDAWPKPGVR